MAEKKTGDPKDDEQPAGGARFVPVAAMYGVQTTVPAPLTAGPPQPEPEERWTLAPGHVPERPAGEDDDAPAKSAPVEPVRAKVTRPAPEDSAPDRS